MTRLRTGVVGLGEVAQIIHLPILESLPEMFEITAVCDISPGLLKRVGDRYAVEARYGDAAEMFASAELDCALVLNSDEFHTESVLAALAKDVHVLVEKPMCLSPREAEQIIAARDRSGAIVMVGYMRRFAPAFQQAVQQVAALQPINYARVHDIIGRNRLMIDQTSRVVRPEDVAPELVDQRWAKGSTLVRDAIGDVPDVLVNTYRLLCGLGSHDLSAMRELLGRPLGVAAARQWRDGLFITALFDYGSYFVTYETGVDEQLRFDAHIEVFGETSSLRVQYDTPYIRHLPTVLLTDRTEADAYLRTVSRPHFKDPYTHELEYFHRTVVGGGSPKTDPEDFLEDLDLFAQIIRAIERGETTQAASAAVVAAAKE